MTAASEVVREVGISHCNNSRSLIDHAHAADSLHYVVDTFRKELLSLLWDIQYYLNADTRCQILGIFDSVQHATADKHFREAVDNYHSHHFEIQHQTEAKALRGWSGDGLGLVAMYKQLVRESKRNEQIDQDYLHQLVGNFIREILQHNQKLNSVLEKYRARNASYVPLTTPLLQDDTRGNAERGTTTVRPLPPYRSQATWLQQRGDRPNQSLGLPTNTTVIPHGESTAFQGGRKLYETTFNERKTALNMPKYNYRVELIHDKNNTNNEAKGKMLRDMPTRR